LQLNNGFTIPLVIVAGVSYFESSTPPGMKATGQGLFGAMIGGIGAAVGGLVGGLLFGSLGGQWMYFIIGCLVLLSVGVITILERAKRVPNKPRAQSSVQLPGAVARGVYVQLNQHVHNLLLPPPGR
jgi:MFS family permease